MVYMCGDNSMSDQSYEDLEEMLAIGSTDKVKIIVQIDNVASSLEPNCRRYLINNGSKELLVNLGEVDMADPQTLINFTRFVRNHFEAQKYLLILWDHGNGWPIGDYGSDDEKAIIYDQSSKNWMGVADGDLKYAVTEIKKILRKKISILGFDACLMGMSEVASEISDGAEIMFASEEVTPWDGFPYNDILTLLVNQPSLSAKDFSKRMVEITVNSYNNGSQGYEPCTYSAIDLKKFSKAQTDFSNITNIPSQFVTIPQIRNSVQTFSIENYPPNPTDDYIDLINFLELSKNVITNQNEKEKIEKVIKSFQNSVLIKSTIGSYLNNANGLSVWFPDNYLAFKKQHWDYKNLTWQKQTNWLSFLNNYYGTDDIKPGPVNITATKVGGKNDFRLYWNKSFDLAPVRYELIETKEINTVFSDFCDSISNWSSQGFTLSTRHSLSTPTSFFCGNGNELNNKLTLNTPIVMPSGGILSFWSLDSTEEQYLLSGNIKRDVFNVEISQDGISYSILDSFYGKRDRWIEHRYVLPKSDSLWLRFRYVTDATISDVGVFIDDIKVSALLESRIIVSNLTDTAFYFFNMPQNKYCYFVVPKDSFGNIGFASSEKEIILDKYCEPFSLPSPFYNNCKIYCDFPSTQRPDVYIYTLTGELLKKIEFSSFNADTAYWDGRNKSGKETAAGIYLVLVKSNDFMRLGKIAKLK